MSNTNILSLLVVLLCVALSFFFSGMETGVLALNRFRIRQLRRNGDRRAAVLQDFLENPEDFLWTILVGNTVANFVIFSVGVMQLARWRQPWWQAPAFLAGVFIFYIVCELTPKTLFQRYPTRLSLGLAIPFRFVHRLLEPLVALVAWFSRGMLRLTDGKAYTGRLFGGRDELRFLMQEAGATLTREEKAMISRVLDLPNLRVRQVMAPFAAATTVPAEMPMADVLEVCRREDRTRVPAMDAATGRVAGIVNLEHILYLTAMEPRKPARDYLQPALFLPEELHVEEALRRMQHTGWRLAVVLDRNNRETGIITLQDILKVIFGEVTL